jgi:hypothetical protein
LAGCASSASFAAGAKPEVLDMTLARSDGTPLELAALRSGPTLLFLFATYDQTSQLALVPLLQFIEVDKRVAIIGIALQPDAKAFLDLYRRALSIPFALYFDPENRLLRGQTALGRVRVVPAFVALDARGHIRAQQYGPASAEQLRTLAESALGR